MQATAPQAVAQQQVDQAVAAARNAAAQRDQAAGPDRHGAKAQIKVLDAQIATARLQLWAMPISSRRWTAASPSAAWRPGNYVTPGQELMALVPRQLWVTANFKETQLALMRPRPACQR